jgi:hypothetical protein
MLTCYGQKGCRLLKSSGCSCGCCLSCEMLLAGFAVAATWSWLQGHMLTAAIAPLHLPQPQLVFLRSIAHLAAAPGVLLTALLAGP